MPAHLNHKLVGSAIIGNSAELSLLLSEGADPLFELSLALYFAAFHGHVECVKILIPVSNPKSNDSSALCEAAKRGYAECVELLIPVSDPMALGGQALLLAIEHGHTDCARLLIPASGPLLSDRKLLDVALAHGQAGALLLLLEAQPLFRIGLDWLRIHADAAQRGHAALSSLSLALIDQIELSESSAQASAKTANPRL